MALIFYPHADDTRKGTLDDRIEIFMEAAERYKALILDLSSVEVHETKQITPRDIKAAYNWEEIARLLREVRELPEANKTDKHRKADFLIKLAEVYEVLRAAKMPKLEAVRLALISEARQLGGGSSQVA